ncbi:trypsin-like peptidase domain-containing protein [Pedococcus sp. KACC 23699]|uniref:Trypsin-like peptidase domain-containing protein n=1 Tax=Pedococcus sp. KACC 23699 TaxID=3149228 RepID=A0AAU7JSI8_9MICO
MSQAPGRSATSDRRRLLAIAAACGVLAGGVAGGVVAEVADGAGTTSGPGSVVTVTPTPSETVGSTRTGSGVVGVARVVTPSVVLLEVQGSGAGGEGSGIVLTADGDILTNNHVASAGGSGSQITVVFSDGARSPAKVVGTDPVTDLAVVRVQGASGLHPAMIGDSDSLLVGQAVVAVGAPLGLQGTVTSGIVSALHRPVTTTGESGQGTVFGAIQTDAAINPGNSGGPLVDMSAKVIGIDSAIASLPSSTTSQSGSIGLGFAIPISQAMPIVTELSQGKPATHAQLGIQIKDSTHPVGALVATVEPRSPAAAAGIQDGDVITEVNQLVVTDSSSLVAAVRAERPGDHVSVTYRRGGSEHSARVTLGSDQPGS